MLKLGPPKKKTERELPHTCHAYACKVEVPPKMFMCLRHWRMVPKNLQRQVWRHYQPGQEERLVAPTKEYLAVTREAQIYVAKKEGLIDETREE